MPDNFITRNLAAWLTIATILIGGIINFSKQGSDIEYLKGRVEKLENGQADVVALLSKIDKRLSLISCKLDPSTCLEGK